MMFLSCLVCSHLTKTSIGFRAIQVSHFDHLSYAQQGWLLKLSCNSIRSFSYLLIHILLNHNSFDRFGGVILFVSSKCKRAKIGCSLSARSWFCTLDAYTENDRGFCHMVKSQSFPCMIRVHSACLTSDCLSVCVAHVLWHAAPWNEVTRIFLVHSLYHNTNTKLLHLLKSLCAPQ